MSLTRTIVDITLTQPAVLIPRHTSALASNEATPSGNRLVVSNSPWDGSDVAKIIAGVTVVAIIAVVLITLHIGRRRLSGRPMFTPVMRNTCEAPMEKPQLWDVALNVQGPLKSGTWVEMMRLFHPSSSITTPVIPYVSEDTDVSILVQM
ncbi:hypothetical protein EIP91_004542 [Steccherinum ochraceum]|uniref:Uncharacterized protein n=1 Tax=Steccherinum ochraceum TaxID=92696 RepID=A0A4R0R8L5_9APHY|nr:hypothetical protein EIP91_004542 [Steccherinum ochraceum]